MLSLVFLFVSNFDQNNENNCKVMNGSELINKLLSPSLCSCQFMSESLMEDDKLKKTKGLLLILNHEYIDSQSCVSCLCPTSQ